ncbi:MAG: hypothetical protein RJA81_1063 [Planctomycetota bacterium]
MKVRRKISCFTLFWLSLLVGCSEERPDPSFPRVTVVGKVVRARSPIRSGWIEFVPVDGGRGVLRSAEIQNDGTYEMTGLGPGLHAVRIIVPRDRTLFPFDKFFSPIRRTLTEDSQQEFLIDLDQEPNQPL